MFNSQSKKQLINTTPINSQLSIVINSLAVILSHTTLKFTNIIHTHTYDVLSYCPQSKRNYIKSENAMKRLMSTDNKDTTFQIQIFFYVKLFYCFL